MFSIRGLTGPQESEAYWGASSWADCRPRDAAGIYRVMYIAKFAEAIYVLHCFRKKTQVTSKQDKAIAAARYRAVVDARKEKR
jgi:phage-related protein